MSSNESLIHFLHPYGVLPDAGGPDRLNLKIVSSSQNKRHKIQQGFKTIFGTTVLKHIRKLRLQKAKEIIVKKELSISEAGYFIGYTNLSHFASAFRQEFGVLPRDLNK